MNAVTDHRIEASCMLLLLIRTQFVMLSIPSPNIPLQPSGETCKCPSFNCQQTLFASMPACLRKCLQNRP